MNVNYSNNTSHLDIIKTNYGRQNLHCAFIELCKRNKNNAVQLINSENLSFHVLFDLAPEIEYYNLLDKLSKKNQYAFRMSHGDKIYIIPEVEQSILKWVLITGAVDDDTTDEFDDFLDKVASKLLVTYNDTSILPTVAELIFKRNRKGEYIHDLTWCFFQSNDISTMPLIANYIRSENELDNNLAYKLLNFKPELQPNDKEQQYQNFTKWLIENKKFLYATGESMQQTSKPKHWRASLSAKYIHMPIGKIKNPTPEVQSIINEFETYDEQDKKILAKHSFKLYNNDLAAWNNFIKVPIHEQINLAKADLGGTQ